MKGMKVIESDGSSAFSQKPAILSYSKLDE
jgi:hypothetical protein